ncbi:hypothetical protein Naga_101009g4, partial [Nannochloropsis gaditana]
VGESFRHVRRPPPSTRQPCHNTTNNSHRRQRRNRTRRRLSRLSDRPVPFQDFDAEGGVVERKRVAEGGVVERKRGAAWWRPGAIPVLREKSGWESGVGRARRLMVVSV